MHRATERTRIVCQEIEAIELGDARLNRRAKVVTHSLAARPDAGFPESHATEAELEGFYRFLANERVTSEKLLAPHVEATLGRVRGNSETLVVHDSTEFRFGGEMGREGLGRVGPTGCGLHAHVALAVHPETRDPLGVLAIDTWVRTGESQTQKRKKDPRKYKELRKEPSEQDRWFAMVEAVEARVPEKSAFIHIMDSEADDYELLADMQQASRRFVIRLCYDRKLDTEATGAAPHEKIREFLARAKIRVRRKVSLARRKRAIAGGRTRRIAPRKQRDATLVISAKTVVLRRPNLCSTDLPKRLNINIVSVREKSPPADVVPVEWLLLTTEPIETEEQILKIVDAYRARWTIEEYFKALKTGCAIEKRQLETKTAILKALAIFTPVAWALLRMRNLSRTKPTAPARNVVSDIQLRLLREQTNLPLTRTSTVQEAWLAVARLGGHIKNNGPPGWQVLGRGYTNLLILEAGYKIGRAERSDQS